MFYKLEISFMYFLVIVGLTSVARGYLADVLLEADKLNATASELLLELMIKIATRPYQWSKVHKLLVNIASDSIAAEKKEAVTTSDTDQWSLINQKKVLSQKTSTYEEVSKHFPDLPKYQRSSESSKTKNENFRNQLKHYLKTFVYHRVTGNSAYFTKNPKSYIAVSIVAPKYTKSSHLDDIILEKELQQLKPWTHQENIRNMALLRSSWIVRRDNNH